MYMWVSAEGERAQQLRGGDQAAKGEINDVKYYRSKMVDNFSTLDKRSSMLQGVFS